MDREGLRLGRTSRIAVTIGTVVPLVEGAESLHWVIDAARHVNAEFVVTHGTADTKGFGELPANVRTISWLGHRRLFATSHAVIHHGGPYTIFTSLDAGLPQIIVPRGADQFYNAEALNRCGAALTSAHRRLDASIIDDVLTNHHLRQAAEGVREEMRLMPTAAQLAAQIIEVTG